MNDRLGRMNTRSYSWTEKRMLGGYAVTCVVFVIVVLSGCATNHAMMPTPLLYVGAQARPLFIDVPIEDRTPSLDLLFITDRASSKEAHEDSPYTANRSRSMAFGSTTVEFGDHLDWETLVRQSTDPERALRFDLRLGRTDELGRFPRIPYDVVATPEGKSRPAAVVEAHDRCPRSRRGEERQARCDKHAVSET